VVHRLYSLEIYYWLTFISLWDVCFWNGFKAFLSIDWGSLGLKHCYVLFRNLHWLEYWQNSPNFILLSSNNVLLSFSKKIMFYFLGTNNIKLIWSGCCFWVSAGTTAIFSFSLFFHVSWPFLGLQILTVHFRFSNACLFAKCVNEL
jgi:hypothetical protein